MPTYDAEEEGDDWALLDQREQDFAYRITVSTREEGGVDVPTNEQGGDDADDPCRALARLEIDLAHRRTYLLMLQAISGSTRSPIEW